jgi:hypothetical protein
VLAYKHNAMSSKPQYTKIKQNKISGDRVMSKGSRNELKMSPVTKTIRI